MREPLVKVGDKVRPKPGPDGEGYFEFQKIEIKEYTVISIGKWCEPDGYLIQLGKRECYDFRLELVRNKGFGAFIREKGL